jgi:hypothetical protein
MHRIWNETKNANVYNYTALFHQKGNMLAKLLKVASRTPALSGIQFQTHLTKILEPLMP